jgi:hypothetical protein
VEQAMPAPQRFLLRTEDGLTQKQQSAFGNGPGAVSHGKQKRGPAPERFYKGHAEDILRGRMVRQLRHLRVFLASPGDVAEERSRLEGVVSSLNQTIGEKESLFIDLVRWETHAWPGFGADAQDVINRELEPGDIFIGVLWRRVGTPTQRAVSGTVEEFERAHSLWLDTGRPTMMFYFRTSPFRPSREDLEQYRGVLDFQDRLKEKGALYWEYDGPDEFEKAVHTHLYKEVQDQLGGRVPGSSAPVREEEPSARLVFGVLESSRNAGQGYRTVRGIARATGLPAAEVQHVIDSHPEAIEKSGIPDRKGADLFRWRSFPKRNPAV